LNRLPAPSRRLDWILFGLRWLLTLSALAALVTLSNGGRFELTPPMVAATAIAGLYNLIVGVFILLDFSDRLLRPLTLGGDVLLALMLFVVSGEDPLMLIGVSLFPIITASLRYGRAIGLLTAGAIGLLTLGIVATVPGSAGLRVVPLLIGLLFLFLTSLLTSLVSALKDRDGQPRPATLDERTIEANRLRAARERARAIYEMASTLGATLDYSKVLDAVLDVGALGLRDLTSEKRLIGAVMLFQGGMLRVATARRFTRQDEKVTVPGQRGVLGLALRQAEPVFATSGQHDPELQYFSGLTVARSILAIPLRVNFDKFGVLIFGSEIDNAFSDEHVELLTAIGTQAALSLQNAVLYQKLRLEKEKIVDVEEDARKKLARDLHDGPTQSIAAIAMRVNYIHKLLEVRPESVGEELDKVEDLARRTTKEIRHMLFTLRPLVLETQGLTPAFKQLAEKMKETHDLNVLVESQTDIDSLIESHAQGVLFYIVEEAVNNARKHAKAEHIWVRLYRQEDYAVIEVQDDGAGFDLSAVDSNYEKRGSLGMVNMRERAELAEGTLKIDSTIGKGTRISILVPVMTDPNMLLDAPEIPLRPAKPSSPPARPDVKGDAKGTLRSPAK